MNPALRAIHDLLDKQVDVVELVRKDLQRGLKNAKAVARPVLWTQLCSRCNRLKVLPPGLGRRAVS